MRASSKIGKRLEKQMRALYLAGEYKELLTRISDEQVEALSPALLELKAAAEVGTGLTDEGLKTFLFLASLQKNNYVVYLNIASCFLQLGRFDRALEHLDKAQELEQDDPDIHLRYGEAWLGLNDLTKAILHFESAISKNKSHPGYWSCLGKAQLKKGDLENSIISQKMAIELAPMDPNILNDAGVCFLEGGRLTMALDVLEKASNIAPQDGRITNNYAKTLLELGSYLEAAKIFEVLINEEAEGVIKEELFLDLSIRYQRMGQFSDALTTARHGLKVSPDHPMLGFQEATMLFYESAKRESWQRYQIRHTLPNRATPNMKREICPVWQGESLLGTNILVWMEQAYGDQLVFLTSLPFVANKVAKMTVVVHKRLASLYEHILPDTAQVIPADFEQNISGFLKTETFDYQLSMGDCWAPFWEEESGERSFQRLEIPSERLKDFESRAKSVKGLRVGISWYSGRKGERLNPEMIDKNRYSISTSELAMFGNIDNIDWFNLQYGSYLNEIAEVESLSDRFHNFSEFSANGAFLDYGAQISNLDLVISMDSTAAIYAALLDVEVWVLCPNDPSWFWIVNEHNAYCSNVNIFIKPWNISWGQFIQLEVIDRLSQWRHQKTLQGHLA